MYESTIVGKYPANIRMTDTCLGLKVGMKVMTLCNDPSGRYKNGSLGVIESLGYDEVKVRFDNGLCCIVMYESGVCIRVIMKQLRVYFSYNVIVRANKSHKAA